MGLHTAKGRASERILPGVIPFAANDTSVFPMQTNSVIEQVDIKLTGTLVLASYSAAPTKRVDGLENLIRLVRFTGNTKASGANATEFCYADARSLRLITAIQNGVWPDRVDVGSANGTYNFETNFSIPFKSIRTKLKGGNDITDLDTRKLQSLALNITWRDVTSVITGGTGGTATLQNVQCVVSVKERFVNGVQAGSPYIKRTLRQIQLDPLGSGVNKIIPNIPLGNALIRQYIFAGASDVDYGDLSDAIIATTSKAEGAHIQAVYTGQKGDVIRFDHGASSLQSDNRHRFSLDTWPAGTFVLEYSPTGMAKDFLDLRTAPPVSVLDAKNIIDVTLQGGGKINTLWILDEEFIPNK